jgi:PAS domain S-box-containing protein
MLDHGASGAGAGLGLEGRARQFLDMADTALVVLDPRGRVEWLNRRARELLGWTDAELIGRDWLDPCLPESARDQVRAAFGQLMAGQLEPVEFYENPVLTRAGQQRLVAWRSALLTDAEGRIAGTLSSGEDITERRRLEEELRAHRDRLDELVRQRTAELEAREHFIQRVVDTTPALIYLYDLEQQRNVYANDGIQLLLGYSVAEIQAMGSELFARLLHPDDLAPVLANQELEQFAYVASHDLQEPLRMVGSYVQLLAQRDQGRLDADADEFIAFAVDGANRMKALIKDLLQFSRVGTRGKPLEPVASRQALDLAMRNLQLRIEEAGAAITIGELPEVLAACQEHANCYITKPVELGTFLDVIRTSEGFWLTVVRLPPGGDE